METSYRSGNRPHKRDRFLFLCLLFDFHEVGFYELSVNESR